MVSKLLQGFSDPYKNGELDVEKNRLDLSQKKEGLIKLVETLYNSLKILEDRYETLVAQLANAQLDLKNTKTKKELGLSIELDVSNAEYLAKDIEVALKDVIIQHELLKLNLEKPWTYVQ